MLPNLISHDNWYVTKTEMSTWPDLFFTQLNLSNWNRGDRHWLPWPCYDGRWHMRSHWFNLHFKIQNTTKSYDIPDDSQGETSQTEGETLLYETALSFCMRRTKRKRRIRNWPSECKWARQEKCRFDHSDESSPNVTKAKECIHGNACRWKAQGRCTYYHVDVGVQSVRRPRAKQSPRPVPTHQWQIMPPRQQQSQQQNGIQASHATPPQPRNQRYEMPSMQQKSQQQSCTAPPPSIPPQAWCSYGRTCNQGWRCSLRHFSDQDFLNLQRQVTN